LPTHQGILGYKLLKDGPIKGKIKGIIKGKFPDEWATTKQACRDELVVYLCFSSHIVYIYYKKKSGYSRKK